MEKIQQLNVKINVILETQDKIMKRLDQQEKMASFSTKKKKLKRRMYILFFISLFFYLEIGLWLLDVYNYYCYLLDLIEQIPNISKISQQIVEKQQTILDFLRLEQIINENGEKEEIYRKININLSPRSLNPFNYKWF